MRTNSSRSIDPMITRSSSFIYIHKFVINKVYLAENDLLRY